MVSLSPSGDKKDALKRVALSRALFTPTLFLPLVLLFLVLGKSSGEMGLAKPLVFLASIANVVLAFALAYRASWGRGSRRGANSVGLLANGVLFIFMAGFSGIGAALAWAGFLMFVIGLIGVISLLSPQPPPRFAPLSGMILPENTDRAAAWRILDAIAFPAAFLEIGEDGEERVFASNALFSSLFGKTPENVTGAPFSSLIPPYEEGAKFQFVDHEWVPMRSKRGSQILFMLSPLEKSEESSVVHVLDTIDPDTGLYARSFLEHRGKADVEGCRRHQRSLAVSIFRLDFEGRGNVPPGKEARQKAFNAFGQLVVSVIRACDTAYRADEADIILFMPDTTQQGAKVVTSRILSRMRRLAAVECVELAAAAVIDGTVCLIGDDIQSVDHVISEVYLTITKKEV